VKDDVRKRLSAWQETPKPNPRSVRRKPRHTLAKAKDGRRGSFKLRLAAAYFRLGESASSRAEN
jgi:hypothetical protein